MERKKFWADPADPITCTEICYRNEFLEIRDRKSGAWRNPTPVEAYYHFLYREERSKRQDLEHELALWKANSKYF